MATPCSDARRSPIQLAVSDLAAVSSGEGPGGTIPHRGGPGIVSRRVDPTLCCDDRYELRRQSSGASFLAGVMEAGSSRNAVRPASGRVTEIPTGVMTVEQTFRFSCAPPNPSRHDAEGSQAPRRRHRGPRSPSRACRRRRSITPGGIPAAIRRTDADSGRRSRESGSGLGRQWPLGGHDDDAARFRSDVQAAAQEDRVIPRSGQARMGMAAAVAREAKRVTG